MNKVFYRYIARSFWGPFGFGLAVFCLLLLFGSVFDKLSFFAKSGAGIALPARYILFQIPYFVVKMTPMATLLAVLSALGGMMSTGEWKAGLAGGWRPFDMLKPLLVCAAIAGAGQLLLQETVAPGFFMRSEYLFEGKIRGRDDWQRLVKKDITFSAGPGVFVAARVFDGRDGTMGGVVANIYSGGRMLLEINSASAVWLPEAGIWDFSDGILIKYKDDRPPSMTRFKDYRSSISANPDSLVLEKLVPDGISIRGLLGRLRLLRAAGIPHSAELTLLWVKLAAPLANPAMALIGAAMVLLLKRTGRYFSFGLAVGFGFFFWAVIIMSQEAGNAELLNPAVAGFAPALVFSLVSLWTMRRARAV